MIGVRLRDRLVCQIVQKICRNTDVFQKISVQYDGKDVVQADVKGAADHCAVLPKYLLLLYHICTDFST